MKHYLEGAGWKVELTGVSAAVRARQKIEVKIAAAFIQSAILGGYRISVDNGEEQGEETTNLGKILSEMFTTDEDTLWLTKPGSIKVSFVKFIYGNDGYDVISDYTIDLEPLMRGEVKRLQDEFGS